MIVESANFTRDRFTGEAMMTVILSSTAVDIITVESIEKRLRIYSEEDINLILEYIIFQVGMMNSEGRKIFNDLLIELKRFIAGQ